MHIPFADPTLEFTISTTLPGTQLLLVERDKEMQSIRVLLHTVALDAPTGPRALTISGEMGVGKTRLLAEICAEARERGFRVLEASAYETTSAYPFFPFTEALRPLLRQLSPEQLHHYLRIPAHAPQQVASREMYKQQPEGLHETIALTGMPLLTALARLFPELLTKINRVAKDEQLVGTDLSRPANHSAARSQDVINRSLQAEIQTPDQEKFRLFEAVATLLERAAQEQPLLLCIDNLQCADSVSRELTLYLTVRLRSSRVALVGVTRPPQPGPLSHASLTPITQVSPAATLAETKALTDLVRRGMLLVLPLGPLTQEGLQQHLKTLLPGRISAQVVTTLLARAEGNPFFLEELVRTLTLNKHLLLSNGEWQLAQRTDRMLPALPTSLVLAVEQRLEGLSEECHDLLRIAALFGRVFPADALARVIERERGRDKCHTQGSLDEAIQAALIISTPDEIAGLRFCQGIVQEVLQAAIPAYRARPLHAAIGKALEESYTHTTYAKATFAAELAGHYALGGEKAATLRWSMIAGEHAERQQAYWEATGHYLRVLKLVEEDGVDVVAAGINVAQLYLTTGDLWIRQGELAQATQALQLALERARASSATASATPLLLAHINRSLADAYRMQGRYELALSHLQAARSALEEFAISTTTTTTTPSTGETMQRKKSEELEEQGLQMLIAVTPEPMSAVERILFLQAEATFNILLNKAEEAEAALWRSYRLATEIGDRNSQAFALHLVGWLCGWGERIYEAIRLQEQAHDLYMAVGDPYRTVMGEQGLGSVYQALGQMEQARRYNLRGFERAQRYGLRRALGWLHLNNAIMALGQGEWESCEAQLQQAMQEAMSEDDKRLKPLVLQAHSELHMRTGNWLAADHSFQDALQAATNTEWFPGALALYGHFLAVTGRRELARRYLDRAAEHIEPAGIPGDYYIPFLAEGYLHLEAPERAAAYVERIKKLRGLMYYGHSVDRILGIVAAITNDWPTADQAFAEGLQFCQRAGNQPEEAAILYEQARTMLMRGDSGQRFHQLCEQAQTLFLQYKMQRAADQVSTLREGARQLQAQKANIQPAPGTSDAQKRSSATVTAGTNSDYILDLHLTKRELEVLRVVAEGYTDREVADILVISIRTVNRHLSNIFVKLDVPGRAAAVAYAIRNGLV